MTRPLNTRGRSIMDAIGMAPNRRVWIGTTQANNRSCPRSMIEAHGLDVGNGLRFSRVQVVERTGPDTLRVMGSISLINGEVHGRARNASARLESIEYYHLLPAESLTVEWYRSLPRALQDWAREDRVFVPQPGLRPVATPEPAEPTDKFAAVLARFDAIDARLATLETLLTERRASHGY